MLIRQGRGIGKKMMNALLKHTKRRGASTVGAFPRPKQVLWFLQKHRQENFEFCVCRLYFMSP